MTAPLRIAVIGGGIGGLAAAVSLLRAEFEVDIYEQAPELNEVGGGINMAPNAVRVLHRLGFAERLDRDGVRPRGSLTSAAGRTVALCSGRRSIRCARSCTARRT